MWRPETAGAGTIGSLRYLAVNDASYPDYNYASLLANPSQPATSAFRTRSDVKVWWRDGGPNLGGTVRKGDLGPPFKGADNGKIGPEFAFGQVIGDFYPSNDVLIIKTAWGGRSLVRDFRPPSAVAARGGRVGDFFSAIIDYTRDVLTNLDTEFPEWSGQGYQIVGFGWHQGFNDRINATVSAEYKDNLPDLINDVREVFDKPNLPFVIASTGMDAVPAEVAALHGLQRESRRPNSGWPACPGPPTFSARIPARSGVMPRFLRRTRATTGTGTPRATSSSASPSATTWWTC